MTIYRDNTGKLIAKPTVASVINELAHQSGFISIELIQNSVNACLSEHEQLSQRDIKLLVVELLRNKRKS